MARRSETNSYVSVRHLNSSGIHVARDFHAPEAGAVRLERGAVRDVQLHAAADLAGVFVKRRHEVVRAEADAGEIELVEARRRA